MKNLEKLVRPHLLNLNPYSSARDDFKGSAEVYLDANENPFGSIPSGSFNRYPDPLQLKIKAELGAIKKVSPNQIFLGNGSDEAIDLLIRAFCEPASDEIIILPPTYGMYKVCADINHVKTVEVPLTSDFQIDLTGIKNAITARTKLIFVCSPNNPSGNLVDREAIVELASNFDGLVIVDEAYIDFTDKKSLIVELNKFDNLIILQTFSKAWGLAAIRLGMAFGDTEIIQLLNKIKPPYNVNESTQKLALEALDQTPKKDLIVEKLLIERTRISNTLASLRSVECVFPSDANFLLVRFHDALSTDKYLKENGIVIRNRSSQLHCQNCLRITIGTPAENDRLLQVLTEMT